MLMRNRLGYIKGLIYQLKTEFGQSVDIYKRESSTADIQTGIRTVIKQKIKIRLAVVLASEEARKFQYAQAYLKSNRQFAYGGFYDISDRIVLLDRKDLPSNWTIDIDDYVIIDPNGTPTRYEVKKISEYENKQAYILYIKELTNVQLAQIVDLFVNNTSVLEGNPNNLVLDQQALFTMTHSYSVVDTLNLTNLLIN